MKIVFTGAGTGGHFYPLIAVAEAVRQISREKQLIEPKLYFTGPDPFDQQSLFAADIEYVQIPAGKVRRYTSASNFTDLFVTAYGVFRALLALFSLYPDVVFSKGGYTSVPTVIAARILRIPVVIHESDSKMGRANQLAAKFAYRIAVAFDSAGVTVPPKQKSKIARTGIPVRKALTLPEKNGAKQLLGLDPSVPTVFIVGGSLGSQKINDAILGGLAEIIAFANVIHQTGKDHFKGVQSQSGVVLEKSEHKNRYHAFPYLNADSMAQAAGAADLIVSRAGSGTINEISFWKKPAILIPIPEGVSHDQRTNAYSYAHSGGAVVLEEGNLTPHVLVSEIHRIVSDPALAQSMGRKGSTFANADAANIIAEELISIGLSHENKGSGTTR
jgi:UDP-N-acetylglucosamine--N-acetylmuramyl-(pentapeptide) pyrophosphoryl-undecaprenol N-acetylglucosamine transferase